MTAPALFVLILALVSPILDTTSMATDDLRKSKTATVERYTNTKQQINNDYLNMNKIRTNSDLLKLSNKNIENITTSNKLDNNKNISYIYPAKTQELNKSSLLIIKETDNIDKTSLRQYDSNIYGYKDKVIANRRNKRQSMADGRCSTFNYNEITKKIEHPRNNGMKESFYYNNTDCTTVISAKEGEIIGLTFVDVFHIEEHPDCAYDYLEIRDGTNGYNRLLGKLCGDTFPTQLYSSGPAMWLKFHSDDTIEYEGFHINVDMISSPNSHKVPESCVQHIKGYKGTISNDKVDPDCRAKSASQTLDVLWKIEAEEKNLKIYLNFTSYKLDKPNNCEENFIQVFGSILEETAELNRFCGSVAAMVSTKDEDGQEGNVMHVRMYATAAAAKGLVFEAQYTAFRTLDPNLQETCDETEFDCEDNTCINLAMRCDFYANCRLKTDEDPAICARSAESMINETHIMVILIIFSLILSGMSFVFLFKCIKKLYQDHKIIKEQIRQSCEDRLDDIGSSRLMLDVKRLREDSEPRASLERDNQTNEMFKRQRSFPRQPTSIDSDFIQETQIDVDEEPWRREVESVIEREEVKIERNGRQRRSDMSKKEQSLRREQSERDERERKEIRDVSVGAPDTKESGCQTRESLFEAGAESEGAGTGSGSGSGTGTGGFSTFGHTPHSGDPPAPPAISRLTVQVGRDPTPPHTAQPKKLPDRRPMSNETTRSAPDVIIVSKPVR